MKKPLKSPKVLQHRSATHRPPVALILFATIAILMTARVEAAPYSTFAFTMDQTPLVGTGAITDLDGNDNGTLILRSGTLPAYVTGAIGHAWDFSSPNNGYIAVPENSFTDSIGDTAHTTGITIAFWVKIAAANAIASTRAASSSSTFDIWENGSGGTASLNFRFGNGTTVPTFQLSTTGIFDGNWHHVCASVNFASSSNNYTLYVDGVATSTMSVALTTPFVTTGSGFMIGNRAVNPTFWWNGAIDDWLLFTQPITSSQVQTLYTSGSLSFIDAAPLSTVTARAPF